MYPQREQLGPDEVQRAPGVLGGKARRVAEAFEHGLLGRGAVLSGLDAVLDGVGDRGAQLALDVRRAFRDATQRGGQVALGQRGHSMSPPFRVCSDAVSSVMSLISWAASSDPAALVR